MDHSVLWGREKRVAKSRLATTESALQDKPKHHVAMDRIRPNISFGEMLCTKLERLEAKLEIDHNIQIWKYLMTHRINGPPENMTSPIEEDISAHPGSDLSPSRGPRGKPGSSQNELPLLTTQDSIKALILSLLVEALVAGPARF